MIGEGRILGFRVAWVLAVASLAVPVVSASIPQADRTLREIARVNQDSGRGQALRLDLTMRVGEREPVARGLMISHPSGLARLELRGFSGRVDRYLRSGDELLGAKDGLRIDRPQPLLPPLFLLQPSTSATLRTALETFDILSDSIGLAPCGDQDCFVLGDPRLAIERPEPERISLRLEETSDDVLLDPLEIEADPLETLAGSPEADALPVQGLRIEDPGPEIPAEARLPRVWVDVEGLQVRRVDLANGSFTIFGPVVAYERVRLPAWFEIHEPGAEEAIRFEVDRVVQVSAPPQAFSRQWLLAPRDEADETDEVDRGEPSSARSSSDLP